MYHTEQRVSGKGVGGGGGGVVILRRQEGNREIKEEQRAGRKGDEEARTGAEWTFLKMQGRSRGGDLTGGFTRSTETWRGKRRKSRKTKKM